MWCALSRGVLWKSRVKGPVIFFAPETRISTGFLEFAGRKFQKLFGNNLFRPIFAARFRKKAVVLSVMIQSEQVKKKKTEKIWWQSNRIVSLPSALKKSNSSSNNISLCEEKIFKKF